MDYSKLIYDYLEGELDIAEEQKLFSEMAYNDALREEFGDELKLNSVFSEDSYYQTTPIETTDKVFNQLGFSIPTAANKSYLQTFWDKIGKTSAIVLLFIFGAVSTAGIMYYYDAGLFKQNDNTISDSGINANIETNSMIKPENNGQENNSLINASEMNSFLGNIYNTLKESVIIASDKNSNKNNIKDMSLADNNSDIRNLHKAEENTEYQKEMKKVYSSNFSKYYYGTLNFSQLSSEDFVLIPISETIFSSILKDNKFSVESKGSLNNYFPAVDNINISSINSFEIAFRYNLDSKNSFGIIFGRNNFAQKFNTEDGLSYLQAPELFWLGASYKRFWSDNELFGVIMPYSHIMAGATTIGPVLKLESGVEIPVYGNFKIMLGAESNSLFYNVDGKIYNSNNVGFIYGVKYSF